MCVCVCVCLHFSLTLKYVQIKVSNLQSPSMNPQVGSVVPCVRLQEACKAAIQFSVQREQDAGLLIQMLTGRLKLGSKGEDKIADVGIMIRVAQRATSLIKLDPNQASDALLEALENSEELVPPDVNEARDMQAVLEELQEVIRKSISIRNGEVEEDQEEPGQPECEVEEQTQQT